METPGQECYEGSNTTNSSAYLFHSEHGTYQTTSYSNISEDRAVSQMAFIETPVTHFEQQYNWDCGIACLFMVLTDDKREYFLKNYQNICREEGFGDCVWTIDLAYLLQRFGVPHLYCTITSGVDPGYKNEAFYTQVMMMDETRVNRRFLNAPSKSVNVVLRTVDLTDIIQHLAEGKLVIVLVNANLLICSRCSSYSCSPALWYSCFNCNIPYQGHFIVLCGFDRLERQFLYRNPSLSDRVCEMSYSTFEQARKSYGTDEDIIFVNPNLLLLKNR